MPWRRKRFPIIATITFIALIVCAVLVSAFVWMEATPDKAPLQQQPRETPLQR
jgi:hypothetical protein